MNPHAKAFGFWRNFSPIQVTTSAYHSPDAYSDPAIIITLRPKADVLNDASLLEKDGAEGKPPHVGYWPKRQKRVEPIACEQFALDHELRTIWYIRAC